MQYHVVSKYEPIHSDVTISLLSASSPLADGIDMHLHKYVLHLASTFFSTLLLRSVESKLIVQVPNIWVAYDIIMSFYDQKTNLNSYDESVHLLEWIRCCDYFGLDYQSSLPSDLLVPSEYFELLLDVIEMIGYTNLHIKLIHANLPPNYDRSVFPTDLLAALTPLDHNIT